MHFVVQRTDCWLWRSRIRVNGIRTASVRVGSDRWSVATMRRSSLWSCLTLIHKHFRACVPCVPLLTAYTERTHSERTEYSVYSESVVECLISEDMSYRRCLSWEWALTPTTLSLSTFVTVFYWHHFSYLRACSVKTKSVDEFISSIALIPIDWSLSSLSIRWLSLRFQFSTVDKYIDSFSLTIQCFKQKLINFPTNRF